MAGRKFRVFAHGLVIWPYDEPGRFRLTRLFLAAVAHDATATSSLLIWLEV